MIAKLIIPFQLYAVFGGEGAGGLIRCHYFITYLKAIQQKYNLILPWPASRGSK